MRIKLIYHRLINFPLSRNSQTACRAIIALLAAPDVDSPWNCDAGNMLRNGDALAYESTARLYAVDFGLSECPATVAF
jgi:peroxin-4